VTHQILKPGHGSGWTTLIYTTKKIPHVTVTVTKMRFVGSNSQAYYDNLHISYMQISKEGYFFSRNIDTVFKERSIAMVLNLQGSCTVLKKCSFVKSVFKTLKMY